MFSNRPGLTLLITKEPSAAVIALPPIIMTPPCGPTISWKRAMGRDASGRPSESTTVPEMFAARPGISAKLVFTASCPTATATRRASVSDAVPGKYVGA